MKIKDVIVESNSIKLGDSFDIELGNLVIETGVVGFTSDGVIVEADEKALALMGISGALFESVSVSEVSLGDYYSKATKDRAVSGMSAAFAGSPEDREKHKARFDRRDRGLTRLKARSEKARKAEQDRQLADLVTRLPELKAEYDRMRAEYKSLGGSNWQYADREQNLTDYERKARSLEGPMNNLWRQIQAAEKAQGQQGLAEVAGPEKCWPGHRKVGTKPGTGKNAGKRVNDCEKIKEQDVAEGKMAEVDQIVRDIVSGDLDAYDVMNHPTGPTEEYVSNILKDQYETVSRDNRLHPDDDFEDILDIVVRNLAHDYGIQEAKYQGREVQLGKPMAGDVKKSKVYVRGPKGNVVKVNFGDKKMKIKKSNPKRRKSFRARHHCENPGPRWKARYWSCRAW